MQVRQPHGLEHDALAREGGVAVEEERHGAGAVHVAQVVLLRARLALDDRVDGLEVRRVGDEREVHVLAGVRRARVGHAQVVLDVARARKVLLVRVRRRHALELVEDLLHRLAYHVGEHVEPAAVRHAHHDVLNAVLGRGVDELLHAHDEHLAALEAEALRRRVLIREERLEVVRPAQPVEHAQLLLLGEDVLVGRLDLLADPVDLLVIPDVHVLDADFARVDVLQPVEQVAQHDRLARRHAEEAR